MASARWNSRDIPPKVAKQIGIDKKKPVSANKFTKQVVAFLNSNGFYVWRQNNVGIFDSRSALSKIMNIVSNCLRFKSAIQKTDIKKALESSYRKNNQNKKGVSDVIGIHKVSGKFVAIEIKVGKDQLSPEQKYFLQTVEKNGGYSIVPKDLEDVFNWAKSINSTVE